MTADRDRDRPDRPERAEALETLSRGMPSCAVVDLAAVRHNVGVLAGQAGPAQVMAVVKADGYGHGLVPVARAALAGGATWLGVAQLGEALALRAAGIQDPVLAWLTVPGDRYDQALLADIQLGISTLRALAETAEAARRVGVVARLHLKADTGLGRNGASPDDWPELVEAAVKLAADGVVELVGGWSHLACADHPSHATLDQQLAGFLAAIHVAEQLGARFLLRHLANSAATVTRPDAHFDLVRVGLAIYGLSPVPEVASATELGLRPAMTLLGRLASVKQVPAGHGVSYGHAYTTTEPTRLGLLPLGYADGLPRQASNIGPVRLRGRSFPVAGRVCMDQVVLDLGPDGAGAAAGELATVFGDGADGGPTAEDWARAAGTISYEIVSRIGARVPRRYLGRAADDLPADQPAGQPADQPADQYDVLERDLPDHRDRDGGPDA
jgi:alanine racemase